MLPSSLSHCNWTPFLQHFALLFLSTRSLGFSPSPFLTPFLVALLLHLTSSSTSSFLSLLSILSIGISLSYYLDLHSSSVLGSKLELAFALGLMGLVFATGILGLVSGWQWVERRWLNERAGREGLRTVGFPIVWSLGWMAVGRASPMGRQGSWTPTTGFLFDSLSPFIKIWGPAVIDLVVGALAVLLVKALHPSLLPDALVSSFNGHQHQDLVRFEDEEEEEEQQQQQQQVQQQPYTSPPSPPRFLTLTNGLLLFLLFNLLPSFLPPPLPSPQPLSTHTPLSLACILPPSSSSHSQSDLDRFLSETRRVASSARVLLWPEGAIQVENQNAFEEAMKEVGGVSRGMGVWIGVGVVGRWRLDGERDEEGEGKRKKGNGMVLVGPTGEVVGGYRKVKVVPLVESFSITSGHPSPPPILTLPLPPPPHVPRSTWASAETNYTRSIHLTTLICNDLNHPSLFPLHTTSLILLPSSTFSSLPIALSLLSQARSRALESSSPLLLCDGSPTGVSGFVDDWGRVRNWQVGGGSFVVRWEVEGTGGGVRKKGGRWGVWWGDGWVAGGLVGLLGAVGAGGEIGRGRGEWLRGLWGRLRGKEREGELI